MSFALEADIKRTTRLYQLLKPVYDSTGKFKRLTGELEVVEKKDNIFIDIFELNFTFPSRYPYCFPIVHELGSKIPRTIERHVMPKIENLCFAVEIEEVLLCKQGITTLWFVEKILMPRLSEEYRVNNGERYTKEYSHDYGGTWEFLMNKFKTDTPDDVLNYLELYFNKRMPNKNNQCFCGSGKPYGQCHRAIILEIRQLGKERLNNLYKTLKEKPYKGMNI